MLIFYIRAVALFEIAYTVTELIFGYFGGRLLIFEPRLGLSMLEIIVTGNYSDVPLLPACLSLILFIFARWIVGTLPGLIAYVTFESVYFAGWGFYLIAMDLQPNFDHSPRSLGTFFNPTNIVLILASGIPLLLAIESLNRLRRALATAHPDAAT